MDAKATSTQLGDAVEVKSPLEYSDRHQSEPHLSDPKSVKSIRISDLEKKPWVNPVIVRFSDCSTKTDPYWRLRKKHGSNLVSDTFEGLDGLEDSGDEATSRYFEGEEPYGVGDSAAELFADTPPYTPKG
ncbi:unnamed protein product [Cuscuta epithymum]|uniref:Uncharacterized protein n=1 Tax=Cuscuta epithymum TaxID=186058 RepID=A0AAV0CP20_9ASTE|nr:unnamed protein product [Cuscuta epithymum]